MLEKWIQAVLLVCLCLQFSPSTGQNNKLKHHFKVTGSYSIPINGLEIRERLVAPDPKSPDHLYIIDRGYSGPMKKMTRYLFTGKKFDLYYYGLYCENNLLLKDGDQFIYGQNEFILAQFEFHQDTLIRQTFYDERGNKTTSLCGNQHNLNGDVQMWYCNGQLRFSGHYLNNQKHGLFQSFDQDGKLLRSGMYENGQLVDGISVVEDQEYLTPDVYARFSLPGRSALSDYLQQTSIRFPEIRQIEADDFFILPVKVHIDQHGELVCLDLDDINDFQKQLIVKKAFAKIPLFIPAKVEDAPVRSVLRLTLRLDKNGLRDANLVNLPKSEEEPYSIVEKMPEFPGGAEGIKHFLARNVQYPRQAIEEKIDGQVFVRFVVQTNGEITHPEVIKGVTPILDNEALRVINLLPRLTPGSVNGKTVPVAITTPISFVTM